jgi:hypothetical protein
MQTQLITRIVNEEQPLHIDVTIGGDTLIGYLTPITKSALANTDLIGEMTAWRNRMRSCFLNQAAVTTETTRAFLAGSVLSDPTRMLFIVHSLTRPVGTLGIKVGPPWVHGAGPRGCERDGRQLAELANLLRGSREGHPRLMYQGEMALMDWAFRKLDVDLFWTAVPSNNRLALTLHQSAGFKPTQLIPLYKVDKEGQTHLVPGEAGDVSPEGLYAQRIELERSDFMLRREALMERPTYGTPRHLAREGSNSEDAALASD